MTSLRIQSLVVLSTLALATLPAACMACGEGSFNTGHGLSYQGYLAPRPAAVLVYTGADGTMSHADRDALYAGLRKAGHKITTIDNPADLAKALQSQHYDVVITSMDTVVAVDAASAGNVSPVHVLPVVARDASNVAALRSRYHDVVFDGASLGQYLKSINDTMASKTM